MREKLIFLLFLVILTLDCLSQSSDNQESIFLDELHTEKSASYYRNILEASPEDVSAYIGLGEALLSQNKYDSARIAFLKAATLDSRSPYPLIGLGKVSLQTNDRISETEYFDRARRADKLNPEIYCAIAEGCISLPKKDTVTSRVFLNQGININPKYARLHLVTGHLETLKRNWGLAANAYDRAIFFDPKSAIALRNRGYIDLISHTWKEALAAFKKSIAIRPDQILVYKLLGDLYYSTAKYPEAEEAYRTYISRTQPSFEDKERLAIVLFFNKKYKEAAAELEEVMAASHDESVLMRIRGYIAYETGDYKAAFEFMKKFFLMHDPGKLIALDYIYYARILQKTGNESLAMVNFRKAIQLEPTRVDIYEELARLAAKNRLHREAAEYYQKMIENGADRLTTIFLIGKEYFFEGEIWKSRFDSLSILHNQKKSVFSDSLATKENMTRFYQKADSAFTVVGKMSPEYAGGFIWKGRIQSLLDPSARGTGAKDAYEKALELLLKGDPGKNRKSIIECYKYLGSWYFAAFERLYKSNVKESAEMRSRTLEYFTRIATLDSLDVQARKVIQKMKTKK